MLSNTAVINLYSSCHAIVFAYILVESKAAVFSCVKSSQGGKKKGKGKTQQIKQVRENDFDEGEYDEFDDFM